MSIQDANGRVTAIERDTAGHATAIVGPYGHRTLLTMDDKGFLALIENPMGEAVSLTSTDGGLLTSVIDARGNETTVTYDDLGRVSGETHADGGSVTYTPSGSLRYWNVDFVSAEGRETRYEVDNEGGVDSRRVTPPDGNPIVSSQNRSAAVAGTIRADGTEVAGQTIGHARFGQSKPLRAVTTVLPSGLTRGETLTHTVSGLSATNPFTFTSEVTTRTVNGKEWRETYSRLSNTMTLRSPANRSSVTFFDSIGRPLRRQRSGILPIDYGYDADGRLEAITQGTRTQTFEYFDTNDDQNGFLKSRTNSLLQTTEFTPDAIGRVLSQIAPDGAETVFGWDANGNLTSVTPPGKPAHHQEFSSVNLQSSYSPPGLTSSTTLSGHNLDRQPTIKTHADGLTLEHIYDGDGRLDLIQTPDGPVDYAYFSSNPCPGCSPGALASISDPGGVDLSFTYDGQLTTGATWSGAVSGSINWGYDTDFRITSENVTAGTVTRNAFFAYDVDNLLVCASPTTCSPASADALVIQNESALPRPSGSTLGIVSDDYDYNAYGEVAAYTVLAGGSVIFSETMDTAARPRDPLGRIAFENEFNGSTTAEYEYRYDLQGRLEQVLTNGSTTHSFSYDDNGNRLSLETPSEAFSAIYDDQDRLLTYGSWSYIYTDHGDLLGKVDNGTGDVWGYQYDVRGNLVRVDLPDGDIIEYLIDGQNRRVGKKLNGVLVQQWLWRDRLSIAAELDGAGNIISRFVYGARPTTPEFVIQAGVTYRVVSDHLASVRALINVADANDVPVTLNYDVFGEVSGAGVGVIPQAFAGGLHDPDTGLTRFGARDYDASVGRWVQRDPIIFKSSGRNLYAYVGCDPINASDPNGLICNPIQIYDDATAAAENSGLPGAHNGPQDAFRHCLASCQATRDCGAYAAAALGILNELTGNNPDDERQMDNQNNQCGIYLGDEKPGTCAAECSSALTNYGLRTQVTSGSYSY
jgi:RHS repeat-associated protein